MAGFSSYYAWWFRGTSPCMEGIGCSVVALSLANDDKSDAPSDMYSFMGKYYRCCLKLCIIELFVCMYLFVPFLFPAHVATSYWRCGRTGLS